MATQQSVRRGIEQTATSRVLEHLHREYRNGSRVFPLMELSEATAIDPGTVESVMGQLEETGPFDVQLLDHGEIRWRIEDCGNRPP